MKAHRARFLRARPLLPLLPQPCQAALGEIGPCHLRENVPVDLLELSWPLLSSDLSRQLLQQLSPPSTSLLYLNSPSLLPASLLDT